MPDRGGWTEWGGDGPLLHVAHANGFPPDAYRALLESLRGRFRVVTSELRPLWPGAEPAACASWLELADDLVALLERQGGRGAIGVGHSLGGVVSAFAAVRAPELFCRLLLVDPVIFSGPRAWVWGWMQRLGLEHRLPLVGDARRRRDRWPDRDSARRAWRRRPVFARWQERCFEDYLEAGLVPHADGGYELRYPKAWEARIFETSPADPWAELRRLSVPVRVLRGAHSDTLLPGAARRLVRDLPDCRVEEVPDTGHLLPFEHPHEVAARLTALALE